MSTYAIGDIQGCYRTLQLLLERIEFDPGKDRLWLVGDLVNRGPRSLEVLRWATNLGDRVTAVLGNHDIHLIARAEGVRRRGARDTLDEVLRAPDAASLIQWLVERPFFHQERDIVMVHGGLLPSWTLEQAAALASEAADALRSPESRLELLHALYDNEQPARWSPSLDGLLRMRVIVDAFTRLRTLTEDGEACTDFSGPPEEAPPGCRAWFELAKTGQATVVFGHWAALGLYIDERFVGLDSGCVWGGALSAMRLEDREIFQQPNAEQ